LNYCRRFCAGTRRRYREADGVGSFFLGISLPTPIQVDFSWLFSSNADCFHQPLLELQPPYFDRPIEEIVPRVKRTRLIRFNVINVAVFECAASEREVFGTVVDKQGALHECAVIESAELGSAAKIESFRKEHIAEEDTFFEDVGHGCSLFSGETLYKASSSSTRL
jgi:hypothetical protein